MVNFFGSKDSRTASPMKVTTVRSMTRVPKALVTIQGAVRSVAVPCFNNSPRLGVGGGRPKPRKSSAVMDVIAEITMKGIKVTSVDNTLGRICRKMMRVLEAPRTLAAAT